MKERECAELIVSIAGAIISAVAVGVCLEDYGMGIVGMIIYIIIAMIMAGLFVFGMMERATTTGGVIALGIGAALASPGVSLLTVYFLEVIRAIIGFVIGFINKFGFGTTVGLIIVIPIAIFFLILYWLG